MGLLTEHIKNIRTNIISPYVSGNVLDMGCGYGEIYTKYKDKIENYYGVDYDVQIISGLKNKFPNANFFVKNLDSDSLEFDVKFDSILMIALVEHIYNQKHLFCEAIKNLKPQGKIIITTPTVLGNDFIHKFGSSIGLFCQTAADDHIVIYNKKRFQILAKDLNLRICQYRKFELGCNQLVVLEQQA